MAQKGDTMYLGGNFTYAGCLDSITSYGSLLDPATGLQQRNWPKPNGEVYIAIPDGSGGFYLGGSFTRLGTDVRNRIAHVDQNGLVTSQLASANLNNGVNSLALQGNILYVGGGFTAAGDDIQSNVVRNRVAAFDISTGQLTSWNPNSNNPVYAVAVKDTTVYIGGVFSNIGGANVSNFAAVSAFTGLSGTWKPGASAEVTALAFAGDTLFVGGRFTTMSGQTRNRLAAIKDTTLLTWDPNADNGVRSFAITSNTIYIGGIFNNVGGKERRGVAAIDRVTGAANDWNPAASTTSFVVNSVALHNDVLFVGGNFTTNATVGGQIRNRLVALDVTIDTLMALPNWNPIILDIYVQCLAVSGDKLYVGGPYTNMGSVSRSRAAAFNYKTGALLDWNPNANAGVTQFCIDKVNNIVYAAGSFTNVGGTSVTRLVALDANTGAVVPGFSPTPDNSISGMAFYNNMLYITGSFTKVGDSTRSRFAEIDPATGISTAWAPGLGSTALGLNLKGDTLYLFGNFTTVTAGATVTRNRVVAFDLASHSLLSWNPSINGLVTCATRLGETLYIGGTFSSAAGQTRNRLAALNLTGTGVTSWNPNANNQVNTLTSAWDGVYLSGLFTQFGGTTSRAGIAGIHATTGAIAPWTPTGFGASGASYMYAVSDRVFCTMSGSPYLVTITQDAALPVSFSSIKATRKNNDVKVQWTTASEANNSHFEVERSFDGEDFSITGNPVTGAGNSLVVNNYELVDADAFASGSSNIFYRVKQVDFDGNFSHSNVVRVNNNITETPQEFVLYPNPGRDLFTIDFNGATGTKQIAVYDLNGNVVLNIASVSSKQNMDLAHCAQGIYIVKVITSSGVSTSKLIIRN